MKIGQPKLSAEAIQSRGSANKLFRELWGGYKGVTSYLSKFKGLRVMHFL